MKLKINTFLSTMVKEANGIWTRYTWERKHSPCIQPTTYSSVEELRKETRRRFGKSYAIKDIENGLKMTPSPPAGSGEAYQLLTLVREPGIDITEGEMCIAILDTMTPVAKPTPTTTTKTLGPAEPAKQLTFYKVADDPVPSDEPILDAQGRKTRAMNDDEKVVKAIFWDQYVLAAKRAKNPQEINEAFERYRAKLTNRNIVPTVGGYRVAIGVLA